jgi:hypothetical protein
MRQFVLVAGLIASTTLFAEPSENDLRMAGECQALGVSIIQNGNEFRDTTWRQAGLVLMFAPMVLADAGIKPPFEGNGAYKSALDSTSAELASQVPSPSSPGYRNRLKPCLDWAGKIPALADKPATGKQKTD